jgi:hypothetical protein
MSYSPLNFKVLYINAIYPARLPALSELRRSLCPDSDVYASLKRAMKNPILKCAGFLAVSGVQTEATTKK